MKWKKYVWLRNSSESVSEIAIVQAIYDCKFNIFFQFNIYQGHPTRKSLKRDLSIGVSNGSEILVKNTLT